jgi:hypothetical protein
VGEAVATTSQALTSDNGIWQNGLATNGIWQNGIWQNGIWQNGIWQNGIWQNGIWQNGIWQNGIWQNGIWQNGLTMNGIWQNGIWQNGIWQNGIWQNGIAGETLRTSPYARELLQYIYACAMPGSLDPSTNPPTAIDPRTYDATLDPNNGALTCSTNTPCDDGYTCTSEGICVVPLTGAIGVGVNSDGTTWWGSGTCDEECQRWVSACVLARTNAYGVHVDISMRAPANAPQTIKNALAVTDTECNGNGNPDNAYSHREGSFFGNIFATTPETAAENGAAVGPVDSTPIFYACAGPDSNIPEITKRFCSSQGDQVVIQVPGVCLSGSGPFSSGLCSVSSNDCTNEDPSEVVAQDCHPSSGSGPCTDYRDPNCYSEVITVFLKLPISVCGNSVCETGENDASSPGYCPDDCHPGTWAKDYRKPNNFRTDQMNTKTGPDIDSVFRVGMFAVGPDDAILAIAEYATGRDLGGGQLSAQGGQFALVKYQPDGTWTWNTQFGQTGTCSHDTTYHNCDQLYNINGVSVGPNGDIAVVGFAYHYDAAGEQNDGVWIGKFTTDGVPSAPIVLVPGLPVNFGGEVGDVQLSRGVTVDSSGDVVLAATYQGTAQFGSFTLTSTGFVPGSDSGTDDIAVLKVDPSGDVLWATSIGGNNDDVPFSLSLDAAGNAVLTTMGNEGGDAQAPARHGLVKLAASDGATMWALDSGPNAVFSVAGTDPNDPSGAVYASGYFGTGQDFGSGPVTTAGLPPFIAKYRGVDGTLLWAKYPTVICLPGQTTCGDSFATAETDRRNAEGLDISFDVAGNVVLGAYGNPVVGGGLDFGVGTFPLFSTNNGFLAAYTPGGDVVWAKQIPLILESNLIGMAVDSHDRLVVGGNFSGSMQIDDDMLTTANPLDQHNTVDTFLASFSAPSPDDHSPPVIGAASDNTGTPVFTVPKHIVAQATSAAGAVVFFMPPTAEDNGKDGVSVACWPPPNTMFPLGTTTVTCTASDPLGNRSSATFPVTVIDALPPLISGVPSDISGVEATGPHGAVVTYPTPVAVDQVDGSRPVTCNPPSGHRFPIKTTTVSCSSSDTRGNEADASFTVNVVDTTPPVLSLPCDITETTDDKHGTHVVYKAFATDLVDGKIVPECSPASGSRFPVGTTTVHCKASDEHGNKAVGSFTVHVRYERHGGRSNGDDRDDD